MSRDYPALELSWPALAADDLTDQLLAALDDMGVTAIEERPAGLRVFFTSAVDRDRAAAILAEVDIRLHCTSADIPDDGWAQRSQAALTPVRVGTFVVAPPWSRTAASQSPGDITIVIQPSMGFGTGHHASTRLVLTLLQATPTHGRTMLDVGTGSGVLAIAGWRLGASQIVGIDCDEDAVRSARENLDLNGATGAVVLQCVDLGRGAPGGPFDIVTANLTGGMLERSADQLRGLVRPRGVLIASGFQADEVPRVVGAFETVGLRVTARADEDGWVAVSASPSAPTTD